MLKAAGFDYVESKLNTSASELRRTLREFGSKTRQADVAVVYYAGHGIELDGTNYLIPIDASLETDADVLDEAVPLERVLFAIEPAKQLRLVILDACRDNPFAKTMKRTIASRTIGRGLAKVEPTSPNTLIAFAAKAGSTASDGDARNSPYSVALIEHLPKPGLDLRRAFGFVRDDVLKSTSNKQEPYVYGSLGGNDVPLVPAKPLSETGSQDPNASVRKDYELALQLGTREAWEAFLAQYSQGFYKNLAKGQLNKIAAEEARAAASERARLAEQEKARLAAEGAKQAELARAAAAAKAAEDARLAAEKSKAMLQEKIAAEERARLADQERVRLAAEKAKQAEMEKAAVAEQARLAEKAAEEKTQQVAALTKAPEVANPAVDLPRALHAELHRVGCITGAADGDWSAASRAALELFSRHSGLRLDAKAASIDALNAVRSKTGRVCPLICTTGYRADGDRCVKINCRPGYRLDRDGTCELIEARKPREIREESKSKRHVSDRPKTETLSAKPQASGQIVCSDQGCRPVAKGCRLVTSGSSLYQSSAALGPPRNAEVCN